MLSARDSLNSVPTFAPSIEADAARAEGRRQNRRGSEEEKSLCKKQEQTLFEDLWHGYNCRKKENLENMKN